MSKKKSSFASVMQKEAPPKPEPRAKSVLAPTPEKAGSRAGKKGTVTYLTTDEATALAVYVAQNKGESRDGVLRQGLHLFFRENGIVLD